MAFTSLQFIFVILPLTLLGLSLVRRTGSPTAVLVHLLFASLLFYSFSSRLGLLVLLASITFNYVMGRTLAGDKPRDKRPAFWVGVLGNVLVLGCFKYAGSFGEVFLQHSAGAIGWAVPIGLSFYTLSQIGYLADAYAGGIAERNPIRYALFVSGFPYVTSGPILRYLDVHEQFGTPLLGRVTSERVAMALTLMAIGLFKKVCLAAHMQALADPVFDAGLGVRIPWWEALAGSGAYSFQLYFDFSGYSDIAVGLGWLCGLDLPWNFDSPYKAVNVVDFWRRWHISLSSWLRTYVFTPLTISLSRGGPSGPRMATTRAYLAGTLITMFICGLWHGAGWTFIVWGLLHGIYLAANQALGELRRTAVLRRRSSPTFSRLCVLRAATFAAVTAAWVVFRSPTLDTARHVWWSMLGGHGGFLPNRFRDVLGLLGADAQQGSVARTIFSDTSVFREHYTAAYIAGWTTVSAVVVWGLPNTKEWLQSTGDRRRGGQVAHLLCLDGWRPNLRTALVVCGLFIYSIMALQGKSEFLYFRF